MFKHVDFELAKRNVRKQGTKILHDIASAYDRGSLDDPQSIQTFASLLACICEGKVEGTFDEHSGNIRWSLTKEYSEIISQKMEEVVKSSPNIVEGPWR